MKWWKSKRKNAEIPKPFLVLPLEVHDLTTSVRRRTIANNFQNPNKEKEKRPSTATLDKPRILDVKYKEKIDMSMMRKEFLTISNLCKLPVVAIEKTPKRSKSSFKNYNKRRTIQKIHETEDETSSCDSNKLTEQDYNNKNYNCSIVTAHAIDDDVIASNTNDQYSAIKSTKQAQMSCSSCGRLDKPERFHTHPKKSIELKSDKNEIEMENNETKQPFKIFTKKNAPKMLICYLCGREYGSMSLKLHEPKCIEKWNRENSNLPKHLRRELPKKPDESLSLDEWNNNAWKSVQEALLPCKNCGRTFMPDRLEVHLKSCHNLLNSSMNKKVIAVPPLNLNATPKSSAARVGTQCSHCGHLFGTHSIRIHEEKCARKEEQNKTNNNNSKMGKSNLNTTITKRPRILPCYICGKPFAVSSIKIHEPQCLKKWKIENDKLPASKRRPEPIRPDYIFTPVGDLDCVKTFDRIWENHLSELVPCKFCGRTFFPDRVEKHEISCARVSENLKNFK